MPMYMDIHDVPGVTPEDVANAHRQDMRVQHKHGVEYVKYWVNRKQGKIFCLCTAPNAEAADAVHREAHGRAAARILEVTQDIAEAFMGAAEVDDAGAVLLPGDTQHDPGTRPADVQTLYATPDTATAQALINRYGIDYVVSGPIERTSYGDAGTAKWDQLGRRVYSSGGTTVWELR